MCLNEKKTVLDKTLLFLRPWGLPPSESPLNHPTKSRQNDKYTHNIPVSHETAQFFHHKMIEKKRMNFFMILLLLDGR